MKDYYVYILSSAKNGTLYIGVTNNLLKRIEEHNLSVIPVKAGIQGLEIVDPVL